MGPVEGDGAGEKERAKDSSSPGSKVPRRFFLSREGAVFAGVCAGLADYFEMDVTLVRIIFIALTVFTGGIWLLLYIALAVLVPYADTAEARAQARGEAFNAEALVQRAKERWGESYERVTGEKWDEHSDFADTLKVSTDALKSAHDKHLAWRAMRKQEHKQWKQEWRARRHAHRHPNPVMGFILGVTGLLWVLALISLLSTGAIFGWVIPAGVPLWVSVVLLFIVYQALTGPLRGGSHGYWDGRHYHYEYQHDPWDGFLGVLTAIFIGIALIWAYREVPQFYFFAHHPIAGTKELISYIGSLFH
jgi:phage shock protein PspC (stress-responsive transcriptional regulator)